MLCFGNGAGKPVELKINDLQNNTKEPCKQTNKKLSENSGEDA